MFVFWRKKKFKFINKDKVIICMFWMDNYQVCTRSWNCRTEASSEKIVWQKRSRRQIACLALTTCKFVEMGQFNLARTVSRKTPFYFNYLSFSTICVRATWVSKRHQLFWRKLSERTRRIFLLLSMHVTTFSIVVTPTLGRVLIFLYLTNYSPYGKVERCTYNFSKMSSIANHFAHLKVPFSSTDP